MKLITICVPMYNESENIEAFYKKVNDVLEPLFCKYRFEYLFINDGGIDDSLDKVKSLSQLDPRVRYIDLSRNYGKEIAMAAGFDHSKGDAVITMDADLQHPPKTILEMVNYWEQGYQDIYGRRLTRKGEPWIKRKLSDWYYKCLRKVSKIPVLSGVGDYRLLDRVCVDGINRMRETQRYTKGLYMWIGFKKKEVFFDAEERYAGETKWKLSDLIGLAIDGLTSNTTFPLKISGFVGALISLSSFIYMMFVLISTLVFGNDVPGYPTLIILILFLGGFQLLSLGILGEYLGKIFYETKNRPLYLIQEESESSSDYEYEYEYEYEEVR